MREGFACTVSWGLLCKYFYSFFFLLYHELECFFQSYSVSSFATPSLFHFTQLI